METIKILNAIKRNLILYTVTDGAGNKQVGEVLTSLQNDLTNSLHSIKKAREEILQKKSVLINEY